MTKVDAIDIIIPTLNGGGAERVFVRLANEWSKCGWKVRIIVLGYGGDLASLIVSDVEIISLKVNRIREAIVPLIRLLSRSGSSIKIAAMWPLTTAVLVAWILSGRQGKLFLSEHEQLSIAYSRYEIKLYIFIKLLIKFSYSAATGIIVVSRSVRDDLAAFGGLPAEKIKVIYNPAAVGEDEINQLRVSHCDPWGCCNYFRIISIGRLTREKDHETLIHAFFLLSQKINARLVILGEGPLRGELESMVDKLNLKNKVSMPGFVLDPYPWLLKSELFVLPSRREGFGNVIVEALECGIPVVCTKCPGGAVEILENGKYGSLVPVGDPVSMAQAMLHASILPHDKVNLIKRSSEFITSKIAKKYIQYMTAGIEIEIDD